MVYKNGSEWWLTLGGLDIVMNLLDNNNRPLWKLNDPLEGKPPTILGYKYNISDQITDTTGTGGTTSFVFGNLKHVWQAKKKGQPDTINVLYSQTAVVGEENFFTDNKDGWRFELRRGFITAIPAAFDKLTGVK
jgi:HK97 family phage major capsid protein